MKTLSIDRSRNRKDLTRIDEGMICGKKLLNIAGANNEHLLFDYNECGRLSEDQFLCLCKDIEKNGMEYPVTIFVDYQGNPTIQEGNHRLRAAIKIRKKAYVEVRYFGNSQDIMTIK